VISEQNLHFTFSSLNPTMCYQDWSHESCHGCNEVIQSLKLGASYQHQPEGSDGYIHKTASSCDGNCKIMRKGNQWYQDLGNYCEKCEAEGKSYDFGFEEYSAGTDDK
jgi:hypothetical protein